VSGGAEVLESATLPGQPSGNLAITTLSRRMGVVAQLRDLEGKKWMFRGGGGGGRRRR